MNNTFFLIKIFSFSYVPFFFAEAAKVAQLHTHVNAALNADESPARRTNALRNACACVREIETLRAQGNANAQGTTHAQLERALASLAPIVNDRSQAVRNSSIPLFGMVNFIFILF